MLKRVAGVVVAVTPISALATGQDYSGVAGAVTTEITSAITTGLPLFGLVLGVFVALRIIKRLAKG